MTFALFRRILEGASKRKSIIISQWGGWFQSGKYKNGFEQVHYKTDTFANITALISTEHWPFKRGLSFWTHPVGKTSNTHLLKSLECL